LNVDDDIPSEREQQERTHRRDDSRQ
jgi:hypothetical protein